MKRKIDKAWPSEKGYVKVRWTNGLIDYIKTAEYEKLKAKEEAEAKLAKF